MKYHWILILLLGYVLGYYFKGLGNMTLAKIKAPA